MGKFSTKAALTALAAVMLTPVAEAGIKFNAVVSWPEHNAGVYTYDTEKYEPVLIKNGINANGGGFVALNSSHEYYYYATRYIEMMGVVGVQEYIYDMSTWEQDNDPAYQGKVENIATATASCPYLGLNVGCFYNSDGETFRFCTVSNPAYFQQTKIADLEKPWSACAFDKNGVLYAIEPSGALYTVNPLDGKMTYIGDTGVVSDWNTGAIVDPETNAFIYATKTDDAAALYSIDLESATATKIYNLENGEQLCGFYIEPATFAEDVPGYAYSKPSPSFSDANMQGIVSLSAPRYTYGGTSIPTAALSGLTYHLYDNGKEISSGAFTATSYYSPMRVDVAVEEVGSHCFGVAYENEAGIGPCTYSDIKFIGPDAPKAPASVTLSSYADDKVTVRWGAVSSTGLHGGNVDRTNATYVLTRYPEGVVVTPENHTTNSFVDEIPFPDKRTEYYYTVKIIAGEFESPTAQSAKFALGPIVPPYETSFNTSTEFWGYTTLNPGTDTKKWDWDSDKVIRVYTNAKPANNYVILPQLLLKPGESYPVTIEAAAYSASYTTESMEVLAGSQPTVEGLTQTVIENTTVLGSKYEDKYITFEGTLVAPEEGPCYLAIHATTPENGGYIYINSIKIGKGMGERAPGSVTEFTATAAADGSHSVELSFKLPTVDLSGDAIDEITEVVIIRDTKAIATLTTDLTPGAVVTYTDSEEELTCGKHVYTVVCSNTHGDGAEVSAETFVGFAAPLATESVSMTEPSVGHVAATWEAVTADVDGRTLSADDVTYNVYKYLSGNKYPVAENVKGTSIEYDAFEGFEHDGSQRFVQTLVEAVTEGGKSKIIPSLNTPVGTPYQAPWAESFADCKVNSIFANKIVKGNDAWRTVSSDVFGTTPADNDGGMIALEAYGGGVCSLMTGKIDLADVLEPAVSMQVYNFGSSSTNGNILEVGVRAAGDADFTKVYTTKVGEVGPKQEWSKVIVSLADYAGQIVQLSFTAYNKDCGWTHLDDIKVSSNAPYNLAVNTIKAPVSVEPGASFNIVAEVENLGTNDAKNFKVNLLCDEEIIDTKNCPSLESDAKTNVTFNRSFSIFETGVHSFTVEIDYSLDMLESDNSKSIDVIVRTNILPAVSDLSAVAVDKGARLTWSAPANAKVDVAVTEDFDAASISWKGEIEGWTFLDLDRGFIGGIGQKQLPVSGRQSFFVFNNTLAELQNGNIAAFNAHSGNQYLCSMYSTIANTPVKSDDWAITPELSGDPQIITLYASSFQNDPGQPQYLETFQLLYSTTDTKPESFTLIEEYVQIPATWRKYTAYVPEGAKYFAIRCVSNFQYMLFVDDVTYTPKNAKKETVTPVGYNIYRDGALINDSPVAETTYTDLTIDCKSTYRYHVSALYDAGESLPSNEVIFDSTQAGIDSITDNSTIAVTTADGAIIVAGADGLVITVVTVDGKTVANVEGTALTRIPVSTGLYIVKAGNTVVKALVR